VSVYDFEVAAAPDTAPFQCVCGAGLPGDGPYVRLPVRNQWGDIWLCGIHQEHVLAANRLMSLRLYEERVAQIKATADTQAESLRAEKERLADIERREIDAALQAREATGRAELAEATVASLRQEIATTNAVLIERTAELEAAKRGSITVKSLDARFERLEAIVAENAGPAPKRALRTATTKGA
jgi:hypothetical protein